MSAPRERGFQFNPALIQKGGGEKGKKEKGGGREGKREEKNHLVATRGGSL